MGHVGADEREPSAMDLPCGRKVQGLVEAIAPARSQGGQRAEVRARRYRSHLAGQRRGVGGDDFLCHWRAAQCQAGHSLGGVLVGQRLVARRIGAFRHAPGNAQALGKSHLFAQCAAVGLVQRAARWLHCHQRRHQVLEHGPRPGPQNRVAAMGEERPAQRLPVPGGKVALGNGQQAGGAGLGGQQVVERCVELLLLEPVAYVQQLPPRVEQETEIRIPRQLFQGVGHRPQAQGDRILLPRADGADVQGRRLQGGQQVGQQPWQGVLRPGRGVGHGPRFRQIERVKLRKGVAQQSLQHHLGRYVCGIGQGAVQQLADSRLLQRALQQARCARQAGFQPAPGRMDRLLAGRRIQRGAGQLKAGAGYGKQMGSEVAAVHGGDIARQQRLQALGVIPVEEVAVVALHPGQRGRGRFQAHQQILGADPAELPRTGGAEQIKADVGGRGPVGEHLERRRLKVVRGQVVVAFAHAALEKPPGVTRNVLQQFAVCGLQPCMAERGPPRGIAQPDQGRGENPGGQQQPCRGWQRGGQQPQGRQQRKREHGAVPVP